MTDSPHPLFTRGSGRCTCETLARSRGSEPPSSCSSPRSPLLLPTSFPLESYSSSPGSLASPLGTLKLRSEEFCIEWPKPSPRDLFHRLGVNAGYPQGSLVPLPGSWNQRLELGWGQVLSVTFYSNETFNRSPRSTVEYEPEAP